MPLQLHVEVRQVDITTAFKESPRGDRASANEVIYQAIRRAIGHRGHAPIRVAHTGIALRILGHRDEVGYSFVGNVVNKHMNEWVKIQAHRPPWPVARCVDPPQMPDFDFFILLDEIAWEALGLQEPCVQCEQYQCMIGSDLCKACCDTPVAPTKIPNHVETFALY